MVRPLPLLIQTQVNLTPDLVRPLPLRRTTPRHPPAHLHMRLRPSGCPGDGRLAERQEHVTSPGEPLCY